MCNHKLKYNEKQDWVFCEKCGKQWSNQKMDTAFVPHFTTPGIVTWTGDDPEWITHNMSNNK